MPEGSRSSRHGHGHGRNGDRRRRDDRTSVTSSRGPDGSHRQTVTSLPSTMTASGIATQRAKFQAQLEYYQAQRPYVSAEDIDEFDQGVQALESHLALCDQLAAEIAQLGGGQDTVYQTQGGTGTIDYNPTTNNTRWSIGQYGQSGQGPSQNADGSWYYPDQNQQGGGNGGY